MVATHGGSKARARQQMGGARRIQRAGKTIAQS